MSSNCTFDFHVTDLYKRCSNLSGWILRTLIPRETRTMMTLFFIPGAVLGGLCLTVVVTPSIKISLPTIEGTTLIAEMHTMSYEERLKHLNLYSIQRTRDKYQIIYLWKIIEVCSQRTQPLFSNYMYIFRT